jgi:RNA polymerase sigma factor (sigma-70 family)
MKHSKQVAGGLGQPTETALITQAQAGNRDSLNRLMTSHENLVHAVVRQQVLGCLPFDEALQAGRIGLWRAIQGYNVQRGLAFSTYAWPAIMHQVWQAVKVAERHAGRQAPSLPLDRVAALLSESVDPAAGWEADSVQAALWHLVHRLPEHLRLVVVARYGLTGEGRALYPHIGALLGVSAERARQLHTEALLWLRQPAHSQQLRSLLERHTVADYEAVEADTQRWLQWRGGRRGRQS